MDTLGDLAAVLRSLEADKTTDRKKAAENLRNLLRKSSVASALTQHSEDKQRGSKGQLTWDSVVKVVINFVRLETMLIEKQEKTKESMSSTTLQNRGKRKQDISAIFKLVVRTAEKHGGRLQTTTIINHVLEVMKREFTRAAYGSNYCSVLLKNILGVRQYWLEIPPKSWHDLLVLYCQLFLDAQCSLGRGIVAQLIHVIIKLATRQCDLQPKKFLVFFTEVFKNIKEVERMIVLEHIMSSLNIFVKAIAANSRVQICKLGETILSGVLYLWDNYPSDTLRENIVEFVKVQMEAHHPCGARTTETGAYAVSWDVWKGCLRRLYNMIHADIDKQGGRQKFISGTGNVVMKDSYIELAADIYQQVFTEDGVALTPEQECAGMPTKRPRLMCGWSALLDTMDTKANTPQMIPWLQLLGCVVDKYPASLVAMKPLAVLRCLHQVLTTCKGSELYKHILRCLASVARGVGRTELPSATRDGMAPVWLQVWTVCLSVSSSRQAESEGYQDHGFDLLTAMLHSAVVCPSKQVWNLFLPEVAHPTPSSLTFLSHLLTTCHLPENYLPSILGSSYSSDRGTFPLRKHLLIWVLQGLAPPLAGVSGDGSKKLRKVSAERLAGLLVQLVLREPGQLCVAWGTENKDFATSLEQLYLLVTLDRQLHFERRDKGEGKTSAGEVCHVIPAMVTYLADTLQSVVQSHLEVAEPQTLEVLAYDCSLLSHCHMTTQRHNIPVQDLEPLVKRLMHRLTSALIEQVKEGLVGLLPVVQHLQSMVAFSDTSCLACYTTAEMVRSCVPVRLTDVLLELVNKKLARSSSATKSITKPDNSLPSLRATSSSHSMSHVMDDFDDFDNFDVADRGSRSQEEVEEGNDVDMGFDDDLGDGGDSQDGEEALLHNTAGCSVLDPALLGENQLLRNNILTFLCRLTGYDPHCAPDSVVASSFDLMAIKTKTEDVLSADKFDLTRVADIQMMQQVVDILVSVDHHVTDTDLENIMDVLRRVVRAHRHDQEVCCMVLSLLSAVTPHLVDPDNLPSQSFIDCRHILLHMISAFWRLQSDGRCNSQVRLSLARCMAVITKHDPEGQWGTLQLSVGDGDGTEEGAGVSVAAKFPHCLIDGCVVVRLFIATNMNRLFMTESRGRQIPRSKEQQHEVFDLLYEICNNMMDIQGRPSVERQQDERWNRTASLLLVLSTAAITSPVCEKKAVFALCLTIQEKNVDVALVSKMMKKMSTSAGYSSSSSYLITHLPYLVSHWLKMDFDLHTFPFTLLHCDTVHNFYSSHCKVLVPQLVVQGRTEELSTLAQALDMSVQEVLKSCLPAVLVHVLPVFAESKMSTTAENASVLQRRLTKATACDKFLVEQLGRETIDTNIKDQLGHVVVSTLSCLTLDRGIHSQDSCEPEANPPSYSEEIVRATLDYLTHSFSGNTSSLVAVLAKRPDGIEQVLLELCLILWREQRVHERLRCLQMFSLFINMLLKQLAVTQLGGSWAFVLRRVISTILQLLAPLCSCDRSVEFWGYQEDMIMVNLSLLKQVCSAIMEYCHEEMRKYLGAIVDVVSELGKGGREVGDMAMGLLTYLLVDQVDVLHTSIVSLDPLPPHPVFTTITKHCQRIQRKAAHNSFHKLMDQVISMTRDHGQATRSFARTLRQLTHIIDTDHTLLDNMLTHSAGSQQASQLMCELLRLTQSPVKEVREEAGRCLGAIGPLTLRTMSLPPPQMSSGLSQALDVYRGGPYEKYCHIFHRLHQYLIDPSVEVVQMVSVTLKKLLATTAGVQFSADYKDKLVNKDYLFQYLHPFRSSARHSKSQSPPSSGQQGELHQFHNQLSSVSVWEGEDNDHSQWIRRLSVAMINSGAVMDPIFSLLQPVCTMKTEFCEMLLPYLVHDILSSDVTEHRTLLSQRINGFFDTHCHLSSTSGSDMITPVDQPKTVCVNKESVLALLQVVNYLRTQNRPDKRNGQVVTAWDNNFWLDLNYLHLARATQNCGAHFSTILFAEIWWEAHRLSEPDANSSMSDQSQASLHSQISVFSQSSTDDDEGFHSLLREAFNSIGDPDAVYGCGVGSLPDAASRVETYQHEKQWEKAVVTLDIQMQRPSTSTQLQLLKAVQQCRGDYILGACLQGLEESPLPDLTELHYQAAWTAGHWDLDVPAISQKTAPFHQSVYSCLHALRDDQPAMALRILNHSRHRLLETFDMKMESFRGVYPLLSRLQCLRQFELLVSAMDSDNRTEALGCLLTRWQQIEMPSDRTDFEFLEPVYSLRVAAVRLMASCDGYPGAHSVLPDILLHTAHTARVAGFYQLSEKYLHEVQHQIEMTPTTSLQAQLQQAQLFWARGEQSTAKHVLRSLIKRCQQECEGSKDNVHLLTQSLPLYGDWLSETRSETPSVIMEQYLEKTVQLLESSPTDFGSEAVEGYFSLARFADTQYQNIVNYMNSPTFEAKQALMNKAAAEYQQYGAAVQKDRYLRTLEKQCKIDKQEVAAMAEDRKRFLLHAVRCYASCLQHGDAHDLRIFRLTSLWFDNSTSSEVNEVLEECSQKLKSYKFLPLMHQLAARMSSKVKDNQLFLPTLNTILTQAAKDHPHHTLWVLLALANANKDEEITSQGQSAKRRGKLATDKKNSPDTEDRVGAAQMLLEGLKTSSRVANIVRNMDMLSYALMELANWSVEQYKRESKPIPLPRTLKIMSMKDLTTVAVPSLEVQVDPSCCYDNVVSVVGYQPTFRLAGGIHLPKIITCRCSDGIDRRQLVKGQDDLRQDAIMQQVFSLVNRLLSHDPATSSRQLHIRTYKVVPLSRRSGLLEWCEGTQPIGEYLLGQPGVRRSGAHSQYRPKDLLALDCRKQMASVANNSSAETKYQVYKEVCQKFQPVFRFFFMEKFPNPAQWFQCRLAYTRSVATNSIVGYILGLGDRHVMNILIDCWSAELIHIDLGIAFEQGHILPTPETVPFRLTRDIVDGMGVTGVEGVFRRCCEKTMEVMRAHQESLMTIVQVLLYDPLSEWTLSPQRAYTLQGRRDRHDCATSDLNVSLTANPDTDLDMAGDKSGDNQEPVNKLAERVLLRLRQKLQGLEDGVALSVGGQVNHLIQTARDPRNLSKLFAGWQPYI